MGVHETSEPHRANVIGRMTRDRSGSEYSENMSYDATTCSCTTSSIDKCSLRGCGMFQEPFFLHPPGSRPRDGIYINPMSAYIGEPAKQKDTAESFYLHSPHDLVYTRITRLFSDTDKHRHFEKKDETLTVKVDVHINNGDRPSSGNCYAAKSEAVRDRETVEHAYEQIGSRQEPEAVGPVTRKRLPENASDDSLNNFSRSRKTDRRYSRSSSASESSNLSSELPCFSSSTSTPSLSRNSSNERVGKNVKNNTEASQEKKDNHAGSQVESEKEVKPAGTGAGIAKPPPPPPPPPPPDREDVVVLVVNSKQNAEATGRDGKKDAVSGEANRDGKILEHGLAATNKSDVSCGEHQQPEVPPASPPADTEEIKASQTSHLVNRHMVLPFIPPKFANADSNTLLKPSEYLKSICKTSAKNSLSKARSVDNLDIQGRGADRREIAALRDRKEHEEEEEEEEEEEREGEETEAEGRRAEPVGDQEKQPCFGPPPPPLSPLQKLRRNGEEAGTGNGTNMGTSATTDTDQPMARTAQPLATISIQDLTSIQLRRTSGKMNATKTFSAPPPRSVSMTNVSEAFFVQKTDLIAELKKTKDIPGIKKLKVEMAQVEKTQEQNLMSEISKAFSASNFVDQIPEKDSSGNVIPIWKRQMLARKAAERAKKELEEQIARENEERRQKAIPAWKRQLLAKKDTDDKKTQCSSTQQVSVAAKTDAPVSQKRDASPSRPEEKLEPEEKKAEGSPPSRAAHVTETEEKDDAQIIIPWRAQLRKTNSKLNILD
ncbi:espin protein forked isoform X3 [Lasioglossum baleicum]|uniref:espin protein forked isoform X3 n=1 Tax=Lasioglossum baleicum TaxID=434251 RepID=UPI003FCD86C2